LRIQATRGEGNLFRVFTLVYSPFIGKTIPITFYIDTGATMTSISELDSILNLIEPNNFPKSPLLTQGIGGIVSSHLLYNCNILFVSETGPHLERMWSINLMRNITSNQPFTKLSLLGLDFLINYKIYFEYGIMILEK
jgi:hypothetical protein